MKPKHVMKLYPWQEILDACDELAGQGVDCFQQFNCEKCGAKQTIDTPNSFHRSGICEECNHETNIEKNGMNYMIHARTREAADFVLKAMGGKK